MNSPIFCVDDGHPLDLRVAKILSKKGYQAIFYIPVRNSEGLPTLNRKEILSLSRNFEIGSHTLSHTVLTGLSTKKIKQEIRGGKETLEDIVGKKVTSFCPPKGKYNQKVLEIAKELGIFDVRSVRIVNFRKAEREGLWHPNLHIYPHPLWLDLAGCLKNLDLISFIDRARYSNIEHLKLAKIFKAGSFTPYFWLHSWEIDKEGLWDILSKL